MSHLSPQIRSSSSIIVLCFLLITACTVKPTATPTLTPRPTLPPTSLPTLLPTATKMPMPSQTPKPEPLIPPPPGLVYRTPEGLWRIDESGQPTLLLEAFEYDVVLPSPNGTHILHGPFSTSYGYGLDYSVLEISTGRYTLLDPGEGYQFRFVMWWDARPDVVLAIVQPVEHARRGICKGIPALVTLNDSRVYLLADIASEDGCYIAPSPDGKSVAFGLKGVPQIYEWETGIKPLDLELYRFPVENAFVSHPAWSPDGTRLAWDVYGDMDGERLRGIGVFDLEAQTSKFLSPYPTEGCCGYRSTLSWSPSGNHLYLHNCQLDYFLVLRADGTEQFSLSKRSVWNPRWSPDGKWLTYTVMENRDSKVFARSIDGDEIHILGPGNGGAIWHPNGDALVVGEVANPTSILVSVHSGYGVWIIKAGGWHPQRLDLPENAVVIDWSSTSVAE